MGSCDLVSTECCCLETYSGGLIFLVMGILLGDILRLASAFDWLDFCNKVWAGTVAILPGAELYLNKGSRLGIKG